ncbi:hypothetical protein BX666DRAFT_1971907 [Dichotomocladium elegans]|nr:hypothetical protein BX666DRAFT_1971907 [Dichotomocladium elegans]
MIIHFLLEPKLPFFFYHMPLLGESSSSSLPTAAPRTQTDNEHEPLIANIPDSSEQQRKDKYPARPNGNYGTLSAPPDPTDSRPLDQTNGESSASIRSINSRRGSLSDACRMCLYTSFAFLMVLSIIGAIVLLAMTPEFAQRSFNDGVLLEFNEASIVNATRMNNSDVLTLHIAGQITLKDPAYGLVQKASWVLGDIGTRTSILEVYNGPLILSASTSMGTIEIPPLNLNITSRFTKFNFTTPFTVANTKELMKFAQDAVASKEVSWQIAGPVGLKLGWFGASVVLEREVILEGMEGLKQANLQSAIFPGVHPRGGIALQGTVELYNPSKMLSIRLGDVDFGIYLPGSSGNDKMIAVVRATDANLIGGKWNLFGISGRTIPQSENDEEARIIMDRFLSAYLHGNTTIVHVRGNRFGPDDDGDPYCERGTTTASSLPPEWLRKALESLTLQIPFPGTSEPDLIRSLELSNIKIDFAKNSPVISADVAAMLKKPDEMQFSINVTEIHPKVYLYLHEDSDSPFGQLVPEKGSKAETVEKGMPEGMIKVISKIDHAPFEVMPGKDDEFQKFLGKIFYGQRGTVYIRGLANAVVDCPIGLLTIHDLEFKGKLDTKGMSGMKKPPPQVTSIALLRGSKDVLHIQSNMEITNPSEVQVNLGLVRFSLEYNGELVGDVTMDELLLHPESTSYFKAQGRLFAARSGPVVKFIGNYISGISFWTKQDVEPVKVNALSRIGDGNTSLTVSGRHPNATLSKVLAPLVRHMEFVVTPPLFDEAPLLAAMQMNILSSTTILWLRNPFAHIQLEMIKLNATAAYKSAEIGSAHANFGNANEGWTGPVVLPPLLCDSHSGSRGDDDGNCSAITVETPKIPVLTKSLGFEAIKKALGGEIEVAVKSIVSIKIDDLLLENLQYDRDNLTAKIRKGF